MLRKRRFIYLEITEDDQDILDAIPPGYKKGPWVKAQFRLALAQQTKLEEAKIRNVIDQYMREHFPSADTSSSSVKQETDTHPEQESQIDHTDLPVTREEPTSVQEKNKTESHSQSESGWGL